jgi:hypothetical protein
VTRCGAIADPKNSPIDAPCALVFLLTLRGGMTPLQI